MRLVQAIQSRAAGQQTAFPTATAALEACAGLVGRAFGSALVEGVSDVYSAALTPDLLALIGRALIRRGEALFAISVLDGRLRLFPVASHTVEGDYANWTYRLDLAGPDHASYP